MPSPVSKLQPNGGGDVPPFDLYRMAVDEYRWQASHNWSRTQYLLAFNAGILTAAVAVATQGGRVGALIFGLGAVASILTAFAVRAQHDYYRAARARMTRMEDRLGISEDARVDTTATLGGRSRIFSVNQVVYLLLVALLVANLVGFASVAAR